MTCGWCWRSWSHAAPRWRCRVCWRVVPGCRSPGGLGVGCLRLSFKAGRLPPGRWGRGSPGCLIWVSSDAATWSTSTAYRTRSPAESYRPLPTVCRSSTRSTISACCGTTSAHSAPLLAPKSAAGSCCGPLEWTTRCSADITAAELWGCLFSCFGGVGGDGLGARSWLMYLFVDHSAICADGCLAIKAVIHEWQIVDSTVFVHFFGRSLDVLHVRVVTFLTSAMSLVQSAS